MSVEQTKGLTNLPSIFYEGSPVAVAIQLQENCHGQPMMMGAKFYLSVCLPLDLRLWEGAEVGALCSQVVLHQTRKKIIYLLMCQQEAASCLKCHCCFLISVIETKRPCLNKCMDSVFPVNSFGF